MLTTDDVIAGARQTFGAAGVAAVRGEPAYLDRTANGYSEDGGPAANDQPRER